jgi:predicted nuclease of predicted toxin-antitoxin system
MSIKLLVDMNLSVEWIEVLGKEGFLAVHWSSVGDPAANNAAIMAWASTNNYVNYVVFTHDLDFGTTLALTHATGPSVLQLRGPDVMPEDVGQVVFQALQRHEADLASGALVVVDVRKSRVRVLPI